MRITLHALLTTVAVATISSCSYNEQPVDNTLQKNAKESQVYTLQPRSKKLRKHTYRGISGLRALSSGSEFMKYPEQYLGRGYKVGDGVIGHPSNLALPVLNTEELVKDPEFRDAIISDRLAHAASSVQTTFGTEFNMEHELEAKKIKGGFYLNLGLFSIGSKKSYTKTFESLHLKKASYALGRLNLYWYERLVRLGSTDFLLRKAAYTHLSKSFMSNLYNSSIPELLEAYGPFVVTGYYTGGRATSKYLFEAKDKLFAEAWAKNVSSYIGASFSWNPPSMTSKTDSTKNGAGLFFGFARGEGKSVAEQNKISDVYHETRLYGGAQEFAYSAPPQDMKSAFIDLTSWFRSLQNERSHTLIDISDQGLAGLEQFILESNLKERLSRTLSGKLPKDQPFETPYIFIQSGSNRMPIDNPYPNSLGSKNYDKWVSVGVLYTRHGDQVMLIDRDFNYRSSLTREEFGTDNILDPENYGNERMRWYREAARNLGYEYSKIFECEIKVNGGWFPVIGEEFDNPAFAKTFFDFSSTRIYRYKNPRTNICYIYDESTKSAFSYYDDGEDSILDDYGLATWAERLPSKKISMRKLAEYYNIIGL